MSSIAPTQKIHAYLAHQGIASRRKAEELVKEGKVKINGQLAQVGQRIDPTHDVVSIHGEVLKRPVTLLYFLVNKPVGVVSTVKDELNRPSVLELIPETKERLYPVGRLDQDSSGLMLLTNDGDLAYQLTHPKFEIPKTYQVRIGSRPTTKALEHLRRGVRLKEGYTSPAEVTILSHEQSATWLEITIHEGRNRQVRRMMERVGYTVQELIRVQLGPFHLDQLDKKKYLQLSQEDISALDQYLHHN